MYTDVMTEIARFKAGRIHVARAGLATQARLCVDMLQQGRGMAWVVKNRDELLTARALMRLFSPELSSSDFLPDACDKGGWTSLPDGTLVRPVRIAQRAGQRAYPDRR